MLSSTGRSIAQKVPLATPNKKGLLFFKNIEEGYQANISSAKRSIVVEPYSAIQTKKRNTISHTSPSSQRPVEEAKDLFDAKHAIFDLWRDPKG